MIHTYSITNTTKIIHAPVPQYSSSVRTPYATKPACPVGKSSGVSPSMAEPSGFRLYERVLHDEDKELQSNIRREMAKKARNFFIAEVEGLEMIERPLTKEEKEVFVASFRDLLDLEGLINGAKNK